VREHQTDALCPRYVVAFRCDEEPVDAGVQNLLCRCAGYLVNLFEKDEEEG